MRKIIPYNPKLAKAAKKLRNNSTLSEVLLWEHLKKKKMEGCDFHRQKPVGNYILDFFCSELLLAIKIDGISHEEKYAYDVKRQETLERHGINFLRFQDIEVKRNMESVVGAIREWIKEHSSCL
jgi:very-short-patch-repair endonuclease